MSTVVAPRTLESPALPPPGSPVLRGIMAERFNRTCFHCHRQTDSYVLDPDGRTWNTDHLKPTARGGEHTNENCVLSCHSCNQSKHANDKPRPIEARALVYGFSPAALKIRGQQVVHSWALREDRRDLIPLNVIGNAFDCSQKSLIGAALSVGFRVARCQHSGGYGTTRAGIIWLTEQLSGYTWAELGGAA